MIQKLLTKYGLAFHVVCVCLFPLVYLGQSRLFGFMPLLWLSLVAAELMLLLPSIRRGETLADARQRVLSKLAWDPFLYIGLAVVSVVAVQWLNSGCELVYLSDADLWQLSKPPVPWAPFSVEPRAALTQVSVFSACVLVGVVLRVALSKASVRLLLQVLAGSSGAVALFWVFQACQKVQPYLGLASGLDDSVVGLYFSFWLLLGMGLFIDVLARGQRGSVPLFVLSVGGNLLGMLFFANAPTVMAVTALTVILVVYWLFYLAPYVTKLTQFKLFGVSLLVAAAVVVVLLFLYPHNPVVAKVKAAFPFVDYLNSLSALKSIRAKAAMDIWQEHAWVGVGADGFYHFVGLSVASKDWGLIKTGQEYVYNDGLQFLCEYGVLGAGLLLAALITLLAPVCYRARIAWKYGEKDENDGRIFFLRLSPIVVTGVLATGLCVLESWFASPFRSAGLLLAWTCVMAAMPAFLPAQPHEGVKG